MSAMGIQIFWRKCEFSVGMDEVGPFRTGKIHSLLRPIVHVLPIIKRIFFFERGPFASLL